MTRAAAIDEIETIAVIGAGLMGHGIAQIFASHGFKVRIHDPSAAALASVKTRIAAGLADAGLSTDCLSAVEPFSSLAEAVSKADFIVEAALENLAVKQALFAEVEAAAPAHAILASNTSVIPITAIMSGLRDRSRGIGTHWWNPAVLIPLVEVIGTEWTTDAVVATTMALHIAIGKTPIHVKRDVPGFIGNRMQHALWREAIAIVEAGICSAADVDTVVKASFGKRLAVLGPLENADLVGTDLTLAIHNTILPSIDSRPGPSPYLERLVAEGRLGMKSGEGFTTWTDEESDTVRRRVSAHLRGAAAPLKPSPDSGESQ